ncbi:hypothetical protein N9N67_00260 [Bacteriovoracaceae bacterium]|nr:hypothetical protein [Bacteriovoracaceae bacterium]
MKLLVLISLVFISCKKIENSENETHVREIASTQDNLSSESSKEDEIVFNQIYDTPSSEQDSDNNSSDDNSDYEVDIYCDQELEEANLDDYLLPKNKIALCHFPPGNPDNQRLIIISKNALSAHYSHGHDDHHDYLIGSDVSAAALKLIKAGKISCKNLCEGDNNHDPDGSEDSNF